MHSVRWLMSITVLMSAACGAAVVVDPSGSSSSTGSPVTDASGSGGTAQGTGGADPGSMPKCKTSNDCGQYECSVGTCSDAGVCVFTKRPYGSDAPTQTAGDCRRLVCLDALAEKIDNSDTDDKDDCTADACDNGSATHAPLPQGTPCLRGPRCRDSVCR